MQEREGENKKKGAEIAGGEEKEQDGDADDSVDVLMRPYKPDSFLLVFFCSTRVLEVGTACLHYLPCSCE